MTRAHKTFKLPIHIKRWVGRAPCRSNPPLQSCPYIHDQRKFGGPPSHNLCPQNLFFNGHDLRLVGPNVPHSSTYGLILGPKIQTQIYRQFPFPHLNLGYLFCPHTTLSLLFFISLRHVTFSFAGRFQIQSPPLGHFNRTRVLHSRNWKE